MLTPLARSLVLRECIRVEVLGSCLLELHHLSSNRESSVRFGYFVNSLNNDLKINNQKGLIQIAMDDLLRFTRVTTRLDSPEHRCTPILASVSIGLFYRPANTRCETISLFR